MKEAGDYPWSSYRHYAFGETDSLIDEDPYYEALGRNVLERQERYREYVRLDGPYDKIMDETLIESFF